MRPFADPLVAKAFDACPDDMRRKLLALRELIFRTAAATAGAGVIEETLRWGEPAYLTSQTGSGSTIRIAWKKARPAEYAMYFNCQTTLVETFRTLFPTEFSYQGNRAIVFNASGPVAKDALAFCIAAALTYHRKKAGRR